VVDVDVALGIFADAVSVAVLDGARELTPVVDGFVLMVGLAEDGSLAAGLVGGAEESGAQAAAAVVARKLRRVTGMGGS